MHSFCNMIIYKKIDYCLYSCVKILKSIQIESLLKSYFVLLYKKFDLNFHLSFGMDTICALVLIRYKQILFFIFYTKLKKTYKSKKRICRFLGNFLIYDHFKFRKYFLVYGICKRLFIVRLDNEWSYERYWTGYRWKFEVYKVSRNFNQNLADLFCFIGDWLKNAALLLKLGPLFYRNSYQCFNYSIRYALGFAWKEKLFRENRDWYEYTSDLKIYNPLTCYEKQKLYARSLKLINDLEIKQNKQKEEMLLKQKLENVIKRRVGRPRKQKLENVIKRRVGRPRKQKFSKKNH